VGSQNASAAQSPSTAHPPPAQAPLWQTPLRQVAPLRQEARFGSPQRPSALHTADRQRSAAVQGSPLRRPHRPSAARQAALRHSTAAAQSAPFARPHLASASSQISDRHSAAAVHASPFGRPHSWSVSQTVLRHTAGLAHGRLFGSPHKPSPASQAADKQPRRPFSAVHTPPRGATFGTGLPFAAFGTQTCAAEHHCTEGQSPSLWHEDLQVPDCTSHIGPPG
jgi:hypothetical protein